MAPHCFTSQTRASISGVVVGVIGVILGLASGCVLPDFREGNPLDAAAAVVLDSPVGTGDVSTGLARTDGETGRPTDLGEADGGAESGGSWDTAGSAAPLDAGEADGAGVACPKGQCNDDCPNGCGGEACTRDSDCPSGICYRASRKCASGAPSPSCAGGLACADGLSCCDRSVVVGGTFPMGRSNSGADACPAGMTCGIYEQPEHKVSVSPFALDTFEITVGRFRKFMEFLAQNPGWQPATGAGAHPLIPSSGWNQGDSSAVLPSVAELGRGLACDPNNATWTDSAGRNEDLPITCINWPEAFAFCAWDGGRLPTEAEWEFAAAGGEENRPYPWGMQEPDCTFANFYNGAFCAGGSKWTAAVGSTPKGNGRWGQRDLAGNVWEWVLDTAYAYLAVESTDWANLSVGTMRVIRSGDAASIHPGAGWIRSTIRYGFASTGRTASLGARCAREP